jgi:hypothetical protein
MRSGLLAPLVVVALGAACKPEFGERASLVDREIVLAVIAEPPEVGASEGVTFSVLVASPQGTLVDEPARWDYCVTAKLLSENGAVTASCANASAVRPIATGVPSVIAPIPTDACGIFGPEITSAELRPRDPDVTGGYYQPARVELLRGDHLVAFGFARLSCNLKNAPADAARDYAARYEPNANPTLLPLEARGEEGALLALDAIPRGARVVLRAAWPPESAEAYVAFDPGSQLVAPRREAMRVSWYATGGSFESDRTGRAEDDLATTTDDVWTAPDAPATVHVWRVLRDSRGGVGFSEDALVVR